MKKLSKTDYVVGLECPGHLWLRFHDKNKIPPHKKSILRRFEQGKIVGQWAKKLFPEGIDIPEEDYRENIKKTKELLPKRKTLFEAAIVVNNLYSRADILIPVNKDEWDVIEVKSSSKIDKKKHYPDLAFQRYVYEKAGLKIRKCYLLHLNKEYVRNGDIDINELFVKTDLTKEISRSLQEVPKNLEFFKEIINSSEFPNTDKKNYCIGPKKCHVKDYCWNFLPESHVFHLYNSRKTMKLFEQGIQKLVDVPEKQLTNNQQKIQITAQKIKKTHIDKKAIQKFLSTIKEPANNLDFETCSFAIPQFNSTRPYQRIPFQFSLHTPNKHFEYLHDGKSDPRLEFLEALKKMLPVNGSVIVYSQAFENSLLRELARDFPDYKQWIDSVLKRIIDLKVPFSNFSYYNPQQKGSASIKKVLPAITGKSYDDLNISDGEFASIAYLDMTYGKVTNKKQIRKDLLAYCKLDAEGMVWIIDELRKLVF